MRTNIVIDYSLMQRAMKATGLSTKKAVLEEGLRLLIKVKGQEGIRRLHGKIEWEGDLGAMREGRIKAASGVLSIRRYDRLTPGNAYSPYRLA